MLRFIALCGSLLTLSGCDFAKKELSDPEPGLPFKKLERDGRVTYILNLPDKGYLLLTADDSAEDLKITGLSMSSAVGAVYSADYENNEFMIFDPATESEVIYLVADDKFIMAPESTQQRHREIGKLFADFFGKHVGAGGDWEAFEKDKVELQQRLSRIHAKRHETVAPEISAQGEK